MSDTSFNVATFLPKNLIRVSFYLYFFSCFLPPTAYSQTLCPQQSGKFAFVLTPTVDNDYIVGIADTVSAEETDNAAFVYMEAAAGLITFAFFIYIADNAIGMGVPYSVPFDSLVCIAVEKEIGGQITFYINERAYTDKRWVIRDDVAYRPRVYNTDAWILSPTKSEGLSTSCTTLFQTDASLLFRAALLGLSESFASQIKNSTLEARELIIFQSAILAVAPNPTSHFLSISVPNTIIRHSAKLILTNAVGKQVVAKQWTSIPESISLEVAALPTGTYFVQLISDGQLFTTTFMKEW